MALAAELLQSREQQLAEPCYLSVDAIPEVATARLVARREAYEILERNRQHLRDGEFNSVSIPVDALGTAHRVAMARAVYGQDSPEAQESFQGLILDSERLLGEAARKNTFEYFKPLRQVRDTQTGSYLSHGQSISFMTEKGLSPVAEPEEQDRRINEHVEEATYRAIGGISLTGTIKVRTLSECTDWAIEAYQHNPKDGHGGYVPEIQKFMVRDVRFDPLTRDRHEEQIGISGIYITHEVITETIRRRGLEKEGLTKTELHGTQMLVDDDMIDFVADLDQVASEIHGKEIYLGEVLAEGQTKDYSYVREEAEKRRQNIVPKPAELAHFIMDLELQGTDEWLALGLVEAKVKEMLFGMAEADSSLAEVMFDKNTAHGLQEVAYLRSIGLIDEAQNRLDDVKAQAPAPGYCGAGSCGLESVLGGSDYAKKIEKLGFDPKNSLKDTERRCPRCTAKKVVYDLKKGEKGCTGCGITAKYK